MSLSTRLMELDARTKVAMVTCRVVREYITQRGWLISNDQRRYFQRSDTFRLFHGRLKGKMRRRGKACPSVRMTDNSHGCRKGSL